MAKDYQALADQQLEEVTQILDAYAAAEEELGYQIQATEADRLSTGQQTIETVELPDSPPADGVLPAQEAPTDATPEPAVSEPPLTDTLDSVPSPVVNAPDATTALLLNTPPHEEKDNTSEQPATEEPITEQTAAQAIPTTRQGPAEPLQTTEPPVAHEPDAVITEPPPGSTPPTDPIPLEPSILDIFDDA